MKKSIIMAATLCSRNDQLSLFQLNATTLKHLESTPQKELKRLASRLNAISNACDRISQSIDAFEMYINLTSKEGDWANS